MRFVVLKLKFASEGSDIVGMQVDAALEMLTAAVKFAGPIVFAVLVLGRWTAGRIADALVRRV
jgi:hypothetical protein